MQFKIISLDLTKLIYGLIFCSGLTSLIYEMVWIRQSAFIFGSSALALSTVLAVFFLGLGLGSYLFGRLSLKTSHPLLWCAGIELILAIYGFASQPIFGFVDTIYGHVFREYSPTSSQLLLIRAGLVTGCLILPTVCMGGTLPLFCRQIIKNSHNISAKLSYIYGFNTLGAAFGCLLTGFVFLPKLGLNATQLLAITLNFFIGSGFYWLYKKINKTDSESQTEIKSEISVYKTVSPKYILLVGMLFFMLGAAGLANELIWTRFLTHFIRNSVYTYTLSLSAVLVGTAVGSMWLGPKWDDLSQNHNLFIRFAALQCLSALILQAGTHLPVEFWQSLKPLGFMAFSILMLPSAIIAGAVFPLLIRLVQQQPDQTASRVGMFTSLNIGGCIFGSLLTGYVLLPKYGLDFSITASTSWSICAAIMAIGFSFRRRASFLNYSGVYSLFLLWLALLIFPPLQIPHDFIAHDEKLVDVEEGYNSNLAVVMRRQEKTLLVDRLWQGVGHKNYQVMVAHVPMIHYPNAQDVLVIGLGAGTTASRFLDYGILHLDIVDIEPKIFDFTRKHFPSAWMDDSRVSLLPEDGRNHIKHSSRAYDVISVEVGQLDRPGVGAFYTQEFYQQAYERLTDKGMISQFVPLPFLAPAEFAGIIKTFLSIFPNAQLWYNTEELLLMGFKGDIRRLSPQGFAQITANPKIKSDININYWGGSSYSLSRFPAFLSGFLASGEQLYALANIAQATVYNDDKMQLSYSIDHYQRTDQRSQIMVPFIQKNLTPIEAAVESGTTDLRTLQNAEGQRDLNVADIAAADLLNQLSPGVAVKPENAQKAHDLAQQALKWNPRNLNAKMQLQNALSVLHPSEEFIDIVP